MLKNLKYSISHVYCIYCTVHNNKFKPNIKNYSIFICFNSIFINNKSLKKSLKISLLTIATISLLKFVISQLIQALMLK